eukprot:TRINITY_DN8915_c0_g2_i1.p1 TRINITY_DN8915_c0_g2~~TRINITY_DN8915_c0_g2_i1.p1  ORF type:complete len:486 (-),score=186.12 TRINITY_DN8915_c0_g2_i1:883-2340(-)
MSIAPKRSPNRKTQPNVNVDDLIKLTPRRASIHLNVEKRIQRLKVTEQRKNDGTNFADILKVDAGRLDDYIEEQKAMNSSQSVTELLLQQAREEHNSPKHKSPKSGKKKKAKATSYRRGTFFGLYQNTMPIAEDNSSPKKPTKTPKKSPKKSMKSPISARRRKVESALSPKDVSEFGAEQLETEMAKGLKQFAKELVAGKNLKMLCEHFTQLSSMVVEMMTRWDSNLNGTDDSETVTALMTNLEQEKLESSTLRTKIAEMERELVDMEADRDDAMLALQQQMMKLKDNEIIPPPPPNTENVIEDDNKTLLAQGIHNEKFANSKAEELIQAVLEGDTQTFFADLDKQEAEQKSLTVIEKNGGEDMPVMTVKDESAVANVVHRALKLVSSGDKPSETLIRIHVRSSPTKQQQQSQSLLQHQHQSSVTLAPKTIIPPANLTAIETKVPNARCPPIDEMRTSDINSGSPRANKHISIPPPPPPQLISEN